VNNWPDSVNNWPDTVKNWPNSVNNWPDSIGIRTTTDNNCSLVSKKRFVIAIYDTRVPRKDQYDRSVASLIQTPHPNLSTETLISATSNVRTTTVNDSSLVSKKRLEMAM
jgi:hypothetical protein